jgi:hypothetical protein
MSFLIETYRILKIKNGERENNCVLGMMPFQND